MRLRRLWFPIYAWYDTLVWRWDTWRSEREDTMEVIDEDVTDRTEQPLPIPVNAENLWLYCGHGTGRHYTDEGRCEPMRRVTWVDFDRIARELGYVETDCPQCECPAHNHTYEADSRSAFCPDGRITPGGYWRHVQRAGVRG